MLAVLRRPGAAARLDPVRTLDVDGIGAVSRVGLGTWQFGSREWGYGDAYASGEAKAIVRRARELAVRPLRPAPVTGRRRRRGA